MSDLSDLGFEPQTSRTDSKGLATEPTGQSRESVNLFEFFPAVTAKDIFVISSKHHYLGSLRSFPSCCLGRAELDIDNERPHSPLVNDLNKKVLLR